MTLEMFFENFDQFADTPCAVAKMRGLILRLAMQGKLSEAQKGDRPVSELLSEVKAEREKLGLRNSIGKTDETFEEAPDEIPSRWTSVRFGLLASHNAGKTLDKGRNRGELRNYITTSNLYWGFFQLDEVRQMPIQDDELDRCTATKGDLLIVEGGEAGRAAVWCHDYDIAFQNHVHRARFFAKINPYFIQRYFEKLNATGKIDSFRKGVGISNMSGKALASIPIPLPPLAEQKRIVAKVDELMALCDRLEAQQQERDEQASQLARASLARFADAPTPANLDFLLHKSYAIRPADLRKSIVTLAVQGKLVPQDPNEEPAEKLIARIAEMRRERKAKDYAPVAEEEIPYEIPFSWTWVRLGNVSLTSDSGWSPQCHSESREGTNWGVLKVSAVSWGVFKPEENKALPAGMEARSDCEVRPGDFLLSRANTEELVARSVVVDQTPPRLMMSDKIVRFTFPGEIEKAFINLANTSDAARAYYARNASGTSSSMKNVGREVMCNLPIAVPPVAEQRRIVAKVNELMALVDTLETQLAASRATGEKLLAALVAELTNSQEKPVTSRPVIEPRKYLVQFVAALLSNVHRPIFFQELTRAVAFLFLPNRLLPLAESVGGETARQHFENFAQTNSDGALADALKVLCQAEAISYVQQDQEHLLKFHPTKSPPIAPLIEQDGKYMAQILDLLPAEDSIPAIETQARQLERELLAVM